MKRSAVRCAALLAGFLAGSFGFSAQTPSGDEILRKIDENGGSDNKVIVAGMIIHGRRESRTVKSKSWIQGTNQSFTEFLEPAREKGTKMLKLGDELWTYAPSTDRIIKISGHLLRQSVMGSDLSYEDMMEDPELRNIYQAQVAGEESFLERPCWILDLSSTRADSAYDKRKIWVDRERYVILKEERFAKSGKLLKTLEATRVVRIQNRWVAEKSRFRDTLKGGDGMEFVVESIEFNAKLPDALFTKASLRK
jgi:outer membrane lipoprotein-sorting protein